MRVLWACAAVLFAITLPAAAQISEPTCPRPAMTASRPPPDPQLLAARHAERQACAADMARLCGDVAPGCGRPMQCLRAHNAQLSTDCTNALQQLHVTARAAAH
jgi:hypothetical protein